MTSLEKAIADTTDPVAMDYARKIAAKGGSDEQIMAALEYVKQPDALFGDRSAFVDLEKEKPIHVLICYLVASGKTTKEIAAQVGMHAVTIRMIQKQPWFRKRFLEIAKEAGMESAEAFIKGEVVNCYETLVEIRDDSQASQAARIAATNSILDRAMGKPTVTVKSESNLTLQSAATSRDEIERQLAAVQSQLQSRGVKIANGRS